MKTQAKTPLLEIRLEAGATSPLQRQLYQRLREIIVLGRLPRGMRLPPSRALARRLGISRNTVLFAYEELAADGLLSGRTGSGTSVAWGAEAVRFADPDGLSLEGFGLRLKSRWA
jgi:GntR family transcriptional regulator/MocR family aminotransferase